MVGSSLSVHRVSRLTVVCVFRIFPNASRRPPGEPVKRRGDRVSGMNSVDRKSSRAV